ncbi:hypothetical protein [Deinococcus fonticola]|nr:hypothetical protein [Deinococcus fonticola]
MTTKTILGDVPRLYQNVRPFLTLSWNDVRNKVDPFEIYSRSMRR